MFVMSKAEIRIRGEGRRQKVVVVYWLDIYREPCGSGKVILDEEKRR